MNRQPPGSWRYLLPLTHPNSGKYSAGRNDKDMIPTWDRGPEEWCLGWIGTYSRRLLVSQEADWQY
jgi:hypothetical protein